MSNITPPLLFIVLFFILCLGCHTKDRIFPLPIGDEQFRYGAHTNSSGDALGGGGCYSKRITQGDYEVNTADELLSALNEAQAGETVYLSPDAEIDLTGYPNITVPEGVTLAGNRGGCNSESDGPLIFTTYMEEASTLVTARPGSRISGIRFRGFDADYEDINYNITPQSWARCIMTWGSDVEIDNCEVSNFHHSAVSVNSGGSEVYIHHNYFHDIHTYPILVLDDATSSILIEANIIHWVWNAIAGTGDPGTGYEARYNLFVRRARPESWNEFNGGNAINMHAYVPVVQERAHRIAGDFIKVHHNTFAVNAGDDPTLEYTQDSNLRGIPRIAARFHNNCFLNANPEKTIVHYQGNTLVYNNLYGPDSIHIMKPLEATPQIIFHNPPAPDKMLPVIEGNTFDVDIEVNVLSPLQLQEVVIEINGEEVYTGTEAPAPGSLTISLCDIQDNGKPFEEFTVTATDNRGITGQHLTAFKVNCQ